MKTRFLGQSGLQVSELCFGAMMFVGNKGWRHLSDIRQKEADAMVGSSLDAGINFFDTADIYSDGESERILGQALGTRRKEAIIGTKGGFRTGPGPNETGCSRLHLLEACDASLKRLNTEYLDLYQIHSFDFVIPLEETLEALDTLVRQGKVRYIGCSNFTGWQLMKAMAISRELGLHRFVSLQALYSLVTRDIEAELVPVCLDQGLGILPWGPLAGGFLTGKYRAHAPWPTGTRLRKPEDRFPFDEQKGYAIVDELDTIARAHGGSIAQAALNYLLQKPGITSVIFGARSMEQLQENIRATEWSLTAEEMDRLDRMSVPEKLYPHWYFDIFRKDRLHR
ncbi:MAG: putative oxidoreductase [Bacteroidetes bacterium]|jgi:aryl-alcohol dehydrogenase-like predicted oxidoreductase|nr:putative oxidoreductase [Bacteroidota bacterium]